MMTHPVVIVHRDTSGTDVYGNPSPMTTSTDDVVGYFEQTVATEVVVGQETYSSDALLVLAGGTVIDGSDQVMVDGGSYEVVGVPARPWLPRSGEHHVEVRLRTSSG